MNKGRLQFRHFESVFETREKAYKYLEDIVNSAYGEDNRLDESLMAEPIVVVYKDADKKPQAIVCIGVEGEKGEGTLKPYHIIDSAKLEEDIQSMSGSIGDIEQELREEIERAIAKEDTLQSEIDATQTGAGLENDGSYVPESTATYVSDATSLKDADTKLDEELARVEKARKDVTGQETDIYVPNQSLTERPIAYISDAESLNDADVKLDKAIQDLSSETVKNVVVDGVSGVVVDNLAVISISGDSIPIGPYENYEGKAVKPHPIHDDYTVLDAIKQLDLNLLDFTEKQTETLNGLHVVKVTSGLDSNVREAYDLVNKNGLVQENSDRILIYKDSSLEKVYLGHVDDYLPDYSSPVYVSGTGDTALCFIYLTVNGAYQLVPINVESFLEESEFKDGLEVNNHEVKVKIAQTSEPFLTVDENGVKLSGIQNAINAAKAEEETRATTAENYISGQVKTLTNTVTAFSAATVGEVTRLDTKISDETTRATAAENSISGIVNTFSAVTEAFSAKTVAEIARLDEKIGAETVRAKAIEKSLQDELDATQNGVGLNGDGTYKGHDSQSEGMVYITTATSIDNATVLLDKGIQAEKTRAIAAEELISGDVTTLSASTIAFSAKTVAEISRVDEKIDDLSAATETFSAATVGEVTRLDTKINNETTRATAAENSISGAVDTFSAATEAFSAATVSEIARLDSQSARNKVKSAGKTILVNEATEGTNLEVNIDNKTILSNNGELKTGLKVIPVAPDKLDSNVREAFMLVDNEGKPLDNTIIKIYKSSSLVSVQLIKIDNIDYVRITYIDNEGTTKTMDLNIQQLIFEAEFKDGLVVNENGEVRVKIDPTSEEFLTVSSEGVKVSGLKNAIDTSVAIETARATAAENSISGNVTTLSAETVAKFELMESGWNVLGSIKHTLEDTFVKSVAVGSAEDANKSLLRYYNDGDEHKYYASSNANDMYYDGIPLSTVIKNIKDEITQSGGDTNKFSAATVGEVARLDTKIGDETVRATAAENSISGTVNTFSAATKSEITRVDGKIDTETTRAEAAEKALQNELNKTQNGAGLNEDGSYTPHNTEGDMANYIKNATSLDEADIMLDSALKALKESMTGLTADINELSGQVETFSAATKNAISNVQSELDTTQAGAGLKANGSYNRHNTTDDMANYITNANSLDEADIMLDSALKTESDRATAAENSISGNVTTLSAETKTLSAATVSEIIRVDGKIDAETARAKAAEKALQDELDKSQLGAGLNEDGSYHRHNTADDMANYIKNATSLDEADIMLDSALKAESNRAITAEDSISGTVNTFSAATESIIKDLQEKLNEANSTIESLKTELKTLSGAVETIESKIVDNVYTTVKAMLQGTSKQIKVTPDDANEKIAIGFADDATFGQQNNG